MFEVSALASGSSGNCFYVGSENSSILVDAGISAKDIKARLNHIGRDIEEIQGIFVTHEHTDHTLGIETLSKKHNIPVYINEGTFENASLDIDEVFFIKSDKEFKFRGMSILPFSKNHDAAEPVSYAIRNNGHKISILTDVGFPCLNVINSVAQADLLFLEANHDVQMLKNGNYPAALKKRILSDKGHLSNYDAALLVLQHATPNLKHVLLSHLSLNNNTPELALSTFKNIISERKDLNVQTWLTHPEKPTSLIRM